MEINADILQQLKATQRPMVLTVEGGAIVIQDAEAYQRLLDLAAAASADEGIRQGLEDLRSGNTRLASDVFAEIHVEHGLSR